MIAIFQSFLLVAASEMGDKTQLLAFVLASRFKKPWIIMAGILVATVLNHLLAASAGGYLATFFSPQILKYALSFIFVAFAIWILVPDKEDESGKKDSHFGAFFTTVITFFLAEMGDKTQLATVALAAEFKSVLLVTIGTTLGMLFSDGIAVFFGEKIRAFVSMKWIRVISSVLYVAFAAVILCS